MPRVRILQSVAGPDFSWTPGEEVDLPGEEASKWADGVRAELVRGATVETPESTALKRASQPERTAKKTRSNTAKPTSSDN